jgi:hypothetical protein
VTQKKFEAMWSIGHVSCSIFIYLGLIRQRAFYLSGSARNLDTRDFGMRRLEPFPWRMMFDPSLTRALLADGEQMQVKVLADRVIRTLACSDFEKIAAFMHFDGRGERNLGAARECKSGALNSIVFLKLVHTQMLDPCPLGFCREFLDLEIRLAHVNTVGTVTATAVPIEDRPLVERLMRLMPMMFEEAGKRVNESMLDICLEIVATTRQVARTEPAATQPAAQPATTALVARRA